MEMKRDKDETVKPHPCKECSCRSASKPCPASTSEIRDYPVVKKALVEIPEKLIEEMKIWGAKPNPKQACYLLFAEKPSDGMTVDGYTRISQSYDSLSYDVNEVIKLIKAGRFPVLLLEFRVGQTRPSPRDIMTWWINDHALGFPLNHGLLSLDKENVEFNVFNLKECFFCEKKSEPLKNLKLRWKD